MMPKPIDNSAKKMGDCVKFGNLKFRNLDYDKNTFKMKHNVTPWAATVQSDISSSEPLLEVKLSSYILQIFNTGDSLWLHVVRPESGSTVFRIAFGMNSTFDEVAANEVSGGLLVTASTRLGNYRINISFPESEETIFRYTTTFQGLFPLLIPFWPRDIVPLTKNGRIENTSGKVHVQQVGGRSGHLYFTTTVPESGSVFYFQNLSAMSDYCDATETSLLETVGGQWPEIGFEFPVNKEKPLPADREFIISDAFVLLSEYAPEDDLEVAKRFIQYLSTVYLLLALPETVYHDWPGISEKVLNDLYINKGCWTQSEGNPYLNAYVSDYKTPPEIMVQLAVLLPLAEYQKWSGTQHPLFDDINSGLAKFYDKNIKSIVRWLPALKDQLDNSEEQKQEMVMDSWYLHHPLLNLARLALNGDETARLLFLDSIEFAIKVARHFDYEWPVFYKMTTLEVIKAETSPGQGGEQDVPGSYAHIMLMAYKLTSKKKYLNEAVKAVKKLGESGLEIFYQANNTAFGAGALVELYRETKNETYLNLSYCCLAGIFKNVQIWDCQYGFGKNIDNFFAVYPLNDAPYTAAYEEMEVYAALQYYLEVSQGIDILPGLKVLIPEFIRYTVSRLASYYPPNLPQDMIAEEIKTGEVKKDLWIPIEDLHDGWEKSGEIGQEVYGAGLPFGIVSRQYIKLKDLMVFLDYPFSTIRKSAKTVTLQIIGNKHLCCKLKLIQNSKDKNKKTMVEVKMGNKYVPTKPNQNEAYLIPADSRVRITQN